MPFRTPFVGRTTELTALDAHLDAIGRRAAGAVEIVGPAGMGKSRLLAELSLRADRRGFVVLGGAGAEFEQDLPFWVFVDALDEYVEALDPRQIDRMDPAVRSELGQVLPSLAARGGAPDRGVDERYRIHRAMRELLERLAATKPLVLLLDDFHWADPASTDLLVALLHRPPTAGILLVIAARPRQLPARLAAALERACREGSLTRLELGALTREQARELVGDGADRLYDDTGGNPFYLEQMARAPGGAAGTGGPAGAVTVGGAEVPPMVVAALAEELALLAGDARRALEGAAIAGDPFEVDLAAAAAGLDERTVLEAVDALARLELVRATDVPRRFGFRHPIVRRAVHEASPEGWRIGAHERVAAALEARGAPAAARAHHVERSARHGDERAVAVLREAGDAAATRAPATAARWYAGALRLLPAGAPAQERVELLLASAQAQTVTGQFAAGHAALLESLEIAPPGATALRTRLAASCARVEHLLGRHEEAHERLVAALDELPDEVSPEGVALMLELTIDGMHRMNYGEMQSWGPRAAAAAAELGDPILHAMALAACARGAAVPGQIDAAERFRAEAAGLVDVLSDEELAGRLDAATLLAGAELYLHRFVDAHAHARRALAVGRATGQGQQFPLLYPILGMTAYFQGELASAVEPLDAAVDAARVVGNAQNLAWTLYARARIALALGDVALALSAAQEAVDLTDDAAPSHHTSHPAYALAEAGLELGKPGLGLEVLERTNGGPDLPLAAPSFRSLFLELIVRCRLALGLRDEAAAAARSAREIADAVGLSLGAAFADRALAAVALDAGDAVAAAELALRSAAAAGEAGAPIEVAQARLLAGRALAEAGRREEAVAVLADAAAEFERRGALRWRDATERELRALGQRIHRRSQATAAAGTGVESLTRRELEIARQIVDRRTNREIAEGLFLSPKTVETHIRNIFGKLGADSRVEVARIVEQADRLAGPSAA